MSKTLEELKMQLKYCKRALKMIQKMYKWKYIPISQPVVLIRELFGKINYYEEQIKEIK